MPETDRQPNACGSCTLCCDVMRVEMEPVKEPWQRCAHACKGVGCAIYEDRPEPCRVWSCLWLHSQAEEIHRMPSAMRPDRSGVVLNLNSVGTILAHCETPAAWMREPMRRWLTGKAQSGKTVILVTVSGAGLMLRDGSVEKLKESGFVDPATNERRYIRAAGE